MMKDKDEPPSSTTKTATTATMATPSTRMTPHVSPEHTDKLVPLSNLLLSTSFVNMNARPVSASPTSSPGRTQAFTGISRATNATARAHAVPVSLRTSYSSAMRTHCASSPTPSKIRPASRTAAAVAMLYSVAAASSSSLPPSASSQPPQHRQSGNPQPQPQPPLQPKHDGASQPHRPAAARAPIADQPVFVAAALQRALRQRPWRRSMRTLCFVLASVFSEALWWVSGVFRLLPPVLRALPRRVHIPLPQHDSDVVGSDVATALDLYAVPCDSHVLLKLLSAPDAFPTSSPPKSSPASPATTQKQVNAGKASTPTSVPSTPQPCSPVHCPVVLYVHGGAWGSGNARQYAPLATTLADSGAASVCLLDYTLYPRAGVALQAAQVRRALAVLRARLGRETRVVVMGHSSGAQVAALALLHHARDGAKEQGFGLGKTALLADVAILQAAPMHLMHHYLFESRRGVAHVSPMLPASGAADDASAFDDVSPTVVAERMEETLTCERDGMTGGSPAFLEGDVAASNIPLPASESAPAQQQQRPRKADRRDQGWVDGERVVEFPQTYVITSSCDTTVPMYSSVRFAAALRRRGLHARLLVYDGVEHADFVTDWYGANASASGVGGSGGGGGEEGREGDGWGVLWGARERGRDRAHVLDVGEADVQWRVECVRRMHGVAAAELMGKRERARAGEAHVRDVLHILQAIPLGD